MQACGVPEGLAGLAGGSGLPTTFLEALAALPRRMAASHPTVVFPWQHEADSRPVKCARKGEAPVAESAGEHEATQCSQLSEEQASDCSQLSQDEVETPAAVATAAACQLEDKSHNGWARSHAGMWACGAAVAKTAPATNLWLAEQFDELAEVQAALPQKEWNHFGNTKAAKLLRGLPYEVTLRTSMRLLEVRGIGQGTVDKVNELLRSGKLGQLESLQAITAPLLTHWRPAACTNGRPNCRARSGCRRSSTSKRCTGSARRRPRHGSRAGSAPSTRPSRPA